MRNKKREGEIKMMTNKTQTPFRIIIGLIFIALGVKTLIDGEYLFAAIALIAGVAFLGSLFLKKN